MKRGQKVPTGSAAATLIGIITLLFIFYILFLPTDERKALLDVSSNSEEGVVDYAPVLLDIAPGRLSFADKSIFDHSIPSAFLSEFSESVILASENPFVIKKGLFGSQFKSIVFSVPDLVNTVNVLLSFQAPERAGVLLISLNGRLVFESLVNLQNPAPVLLPKGLLSDTNQLDFAVTGGFLSRKRYALTDVKIIGERVDVQKSIASNSFTLSSTEVDNLESSFLDFFPVCNQKDVGILTIELNGKAVFSGSPACDSLNRQDLYAEDLRSQKNILAFKLSTGSLRAEQIRVRTILKPVRSFVDYFDVKSSLYNDILNKERQVILRVEFVDDDKLKRADLNINSKFDAIDQRDNVYERDISSWIKEGNNYVEIKPLTELNIVKLEVRAD